MLFAIIFFWTPPHYWPLALRFRDDYAAAGRPDAPGRGRPRVVARQIVVYTWVMVAASLVLWPVAPMGWVYGVVAVVPGARSSSRPTPCSGGSAPVPPTCRPMRLFHGSITYLALLFLAVALDPLLPF